MKVFRCKLPSNSALRKQFFPDYLDCFQVTIVDANNSITPSSLGKNFFTGTPTWVKSLFELREKFAQLVGLKTGEKKSNRQKYLDEFNCEVGQKIGLFKVFSKSKLEVILGEDDKHLNFRISIHINELDKNEKIITLSTSVQFNNNFGKLYFLPVKPIHKFIVPSMIKTMIKGVLKQ